jgi:hypothetical protein
LYPTDQIKRAIVAMYAYILRFLLRALRWYQESKPMHILHAITRPPELRYDDLLKKISSLAHNITEIALLSSHAEQRDLHAKIKEHLSGQKVMQAKIEQLTFLVLQMKESMDIEQAINASARIEVRQSLSDIQLVQFLDFLSVAALPDPAKSFQALLFMRNKRRLKPSRNEFPFWLAPRMQSWNRSKLSSLIMINGTHKLRFQIKDFCTNSISVLQNSEIPVIWAMKALEPEEIRNTGPKETTKKGSGYKVSTIEILKYLVSQAIRLNKSIHTDAALAPRLKAYLGATTEEEWFRILASILQGIPLLYIIIDVEVLDHSLAELAESFSWPSAFLKIFHELKERDINTVIKVALVSYGSPLFRKHMSNESKEMVMSVGGTRFARALAKRPMRRKGGSKRGGSIASGRETTGRGGLQRAHIWHSSR